MRHGSKKGLWEAKVKEKRKIKWEKHGSMEIGYIKEQRLYAFDIHSIPFKKNETIYDGFLFSVRDKLTCSDEIKQFTTKEDCKKWAELVYKRFLEDKFL